MNCPRCSDCNIQKMCDSPVEGAWQVYFCEKCHYSWRSTEKPVVIEGFRLNEKSLNEMQNNPPL